MLDALLSNFPEDLEEIENFTYNFYMGLWSQDLFSPEFLRVFPSYSNPILLRREGVQKPCSFLEKGITIIRTPEPSGSRKIRDRFFPAGSAAIYIRRKFGYKEDCRGLLLKGLKSLMKREYSFLFESRVPGLFNVEEDKKILTLNSWNLYDRVELISAILVPEVTKEMRSIYGEINYDGFKQYLKEEYSDLHKFYEKYFQLLSSYFYGKKIL